MIFDEQTSLDSEEIVPAKQRKRRSESSEYIVTVDTVRIRKEKHPLGIIMGELKRGQIIDVIDVEDGWARVALGYISMSYLERHR